jgi:carbonic anhydrase
VNAATDETKKGISEYFTASVISLNSASAGSRVIEGVFSATQFGECDEEVIDDGEMEHRANPTSGKNNINADKETQENLTPRMALDTLKEGNHRFIKNLKAQRDLLGQVNDTREGQFPFATILSCIDSRTSAELIFDQGLGDIFSVRIAGNIVNTDIIGSMEFACKVAGSKLIVILGHTNCGAVKGACDHVEMGNLTELLSKLQPAVYQEKITTENRTSSNKEFVENVAAINVRRSAEQIIERSYILEQMLEKGEIGVVGAMYNVKNGEVEFYDDVLYINDEQNPNFTLKDFRS